MQYTDYTPQRLFTTNDYAVMLLNRPVLFDDAFFLKIWNNAAVRHVVDGGTNHFFTFLDRQPENIRSSVKYPDIASGDFDSITEASMNRIKDPKNSKCKVILTEDQDETDFTKGLRVLQEELRSSGAIANVKSVVAICEFSGRLDQTLANLNTLHKNVFVEDPSTDKPAVYLMSADSLSWLLPAKQNSTISFEKEVPNFTCGVIPLQGRTTYTSTGLQWDLTPDMICQFGSIVSTSNKVIAQNVQITSQNNHSVFSLVINYASDYVL